MSSEYGHPHEVRGGAVRITINRPEVYNAFRNQTLEELIHALHRADEEPSANAVVLTGAGDKAFCTGGDQKVHLNETGLYGPRGTVGMPIEEMQTAARPAQGEHCARAGLRHRRRQRLRHHLRPHHREREGHLRPGRPQGRLWSTQAGHGHLARHVGEKKARDLVPVPPLQRRRKPRRWAWEQGGAARPAGRRGRPVVREINELSPTALTIAKRSFNADSENIRGISFQGIQTVKALLPDRGNRRKA